MSRSRTARSYTSLSAAPRFAILFLSYYLNRSKFLFITGLVRTVFCGGWVYITSSDSGLAHDVFMIGYIVLNVPWMVGMTKTSRGKAVKSKRYIDLVLGTWFND
jgi:hypothetical protein